MKTCLVMAAAIAVGAAVAPAVAQPAFPPPPNEGPIGPPPGPPAGFVLQPGHYSWGGGRYIWIGQQWLPRRVGYGHFVPGHWGPRGRWIPDHWRP